VYVVSTAELASLRLAAQRCQELERWGVQGDRIQVILNRWHRSDMSPQQAEEVLERPVGFRFRNDYRALQQAIMKAGPVDTGSELGDDYLKFARLVTGTQPSKKGIMGLFRK